MSSFLSPKPASKVLFHGNLFKRGKYNKDWKERWFMLTDTKLLYYFKNKQHKQPINDGIPLARSLIRVSKDPVISNERELCFEIIVASRVFYLSATTEKEMNDWIEKLSSCSDLKRDNDIFDEFEEAIEIAAIERSRVIIERYLRTAGRTISKEFSNPIPPSSPLPEPDPPSIVMKCPASPKDLQQQHSSASSTRLRFLGALQIKPKGLHSTSPPYSSSPPAQPLSSSASLQNIPRSLPSNIPVSTSSSSLLSGSSISPVLSQGDVGSFKDRPRLDNNPRHTTELTNQPYPQGRSDSFTRYSLNL